MNLLLSLHQALTLWPRREAVVDGSERFTYEQFGRRVAGLAHALRGLGLGKGSVAAVVAPNVHQFLETYYACAALGVSGLYWPRPSRRSARNCWGGSERSSARTVPSPSNESSMRSTRCSEAGSTTLPTDTRATASPTSATGWKRRFGGILSETRNAAASAGRSGVGGG